MRLTKTAVERSSKLNADDFNQYFMGNIFLLTEKFPEAVHYYLKAARSFDSAKFYKRLTYSVMKLGALFEGVLLFQLSDFDYSLDKVKGILQGIVTPSFLYPFILDVDMIEHMMETRSSKDQDLKELVSFI